LIDWSRQHQQGRRDRRNLRTAAKPAPELDWPLIWKAATLQAAEEGSNAMRQVRGFRMSLPRAFVALSLIFLAASLQSVEAATAAIFNEKVLYSFCSQRNCKDGKYPEAGLIILGGMLFGVTSEGGRGAACSNPNPGCGTVFSLDPNTDVETVLHSFCRELFCPDGTDPIADLISLKGTLYGTTFSGGAGSDADCCGTVFALDPNTGAETVLYAFCRSGRCGDGEHPLTGLIDVKSHLYGTTQGGGAGGGVVFSLNRKTGAEEALYSFCGQQNCLDGFNPRGLIDVDGTLYGTTLQGGSYNCDQGQGCGTVFSLDPTTGAHTVLHSFGSGTDGGHPYGAPTAVNGILYGTTGYGGAYGHGTAFSVDPNTGVETVLHSFNGGDGQFPWGSLIEVNGFLYGTTRDAGAYGGGTVFSIDPNTGAETVIYSFGAGTDGRGPEAGLIAVNGNFYGTTAEGGAHGGGTVFVLRKKR
jgi:uncharacterized repeat protein (TIGR03803 family)